jgi:hypothetical protein
MNDDQAGDLNASAYWRDRADKESKEKRAEAKARLLELRTWWDQVDRWREFTSSYPTRFAVTLLNAAGIGGVTQADREFTFTTPDTQYCFTVAAPEHPTPDFKTQFEDCERHFANLPKPTAKHRAKKSKPA